jgi:hypothetical protein
MLSAFSSESFCLPVEIGTQKAILPALKIAFKNMFTSSSLLVKPIRHG